MNTKSITQSVLNLKTLTFNGSPLRSGVLYKVKYRKYANYYHTKSEDYQLKSFFVMLEYFRFKRKNDDVRAIVYGCNSDNQFNIERITEISPRMERYYYSLFNSRVDNIDTESVEAVGLDDPELTENETVFFRHLQNQIKQRQSLTVKIGNYPFIHFFKRKTVNSVYDNDYLMTNDWNRCSSRSRCCLSYLETWFCMSTMKSLGSLGIFITERKTSERYTPMMLSYRKNYDHLDFRDRTFIDIEKTEKRTLIENGFEVSSNFVQGQSTNVDYDLYY